MSRVDKYDSKGDGFRAFLGFDMVQADVEKVISVGLDSAGKVVKGPGQTGIVGVLLQTRIMTQAQGEPVDVMKRCEITEFPSATSPAAAGTNVYARMTAGAGALGDVGIATGVAAGSVYIGHTVESKANRGARLVVNLNVAVTGGSGT